MTSTSGSLQLKGIFLDLTRRHSGLVRHSVGRVIAQIASIEFPVGAWPNLLNQLQASCVGATSREREIGIYILFSTLENIVEGFDITELIRLFERTIQDPESIEVRILTVR
jgi:importin-4